MLSTINRAANAVYVVLAMPREQCVHSGPVTTVIEDSGAAATGWCTFYAHSMHTNFMNFKHIHWSPYPSPPLITTRGLVLETSRTTVTMHSAMKVSAASPHFALFSDDCPSITYVADHIWHISLFRR